MFLIQNTQNRDASAMHAKMDELLHAVRGAQERFIGIEHLTDHELAIILAEVEARARKIHANPGPAESSPTRGCRGKAAEG